jgi:hypothetical protein
MHYNMSSIEFHRLHERWLRENNGRALLICAMKFVSVANLKVLLRVSSEEASLGRRISHKSIIFEAGGIPWK